MTNFNSVKIFSVSISMAIVCMLLVSCSKSKKCTSQINFNGKTFTGLADNKEKAKENSCNKFCLEMDPKCDALYRIWVNSQAGKAAGSPSKMKAMYKNKKLLDCITIACAQDCVKKLDTAVLEYSVKCE